MKILILKPSSLGDVIQALPVLRLLKLHWPKSEIYWWIDSSLAPLLESDPDLKGVVRFHRRRWGSPIRWPEMLRSILWLREQRFDYVIDLQCLARSGAFAWLSRGESLIGLDEVREGARGFYDFAAQRPSYFTHAVDWYLETLRKIGVPVHFNFEWLPIRAQVLQSLQERWQTDQFRWIVLQPGARWRNKRWPAENFAEVTRQLASANPELRFAVLGGSDDAEMGRQIALAAPDRCLDLTGKLSLPEMIEWIRACELMISNDTGPMHVAAALGKPVIGIFGPTEPRRTGPYGQLDRALQTELHCVPCMKPFCVNPVQLECLHRITPAAVLAQARPLLESR